MSYQQLTEGKRYPISVLLAQGRSATEVAKAVQVHRSTIYRELKRNSNQKAYEPGKAHQQALRRRTNAAKYRVPERVVRYVELTLS